MQLHSWSMFPAMLVYRSVIANCSGFSIIFYHSNWLQQRLPSFVGFGYRTSEKTHRKTQTTRFTNQQDTERDREKIQGLMIVGYGLHKFFFGRDRWWNIFDFETWLGLLCFFWFFLGVGGSMFKAFFMVGCKCSFSGCVFVNGLGSHGMKLSIF